MRQKDPLDLSIGITEEDGSQVVIDGKKLQRWLKEEDVNATLIDGVDDEEIIKGQKGKLVFVFEDAENLEAVPEESRFKLMKVLEELGVDLDTYEVRIGAKDV